MTSRELWRIQHERELAKIKALSIGTVKDVLVKKESKC